MLSTPWLRFSYGLPSRILHHTWWKVTGKQLHQKEKATMCRSVSAKSASLVSLIYTRWVYRRGLALQRGILEQTPFVVVHNPALCNLCQLFVVAVIVDCARSVDIRTERGTLARCHPAMVCSDLLHWQTTQLWCIPPPPHPYICK